MIVLLHCDDVDSPTEVTLSVGRSLVHCDDEVSVSGVEVGITELVDSTSEVASSVLEVVHSELDSIQVDEDTTSVVELKLVIDSWVELQSEDDVIGTELDEDSDHDDEVVSIKAVVVSAGGWSGWKLDDEDCPIGGSSLVLSVAVVVSAGAVWPTGESTGGDDTGNSVVGRVSDVGETSVVAAAVSVPPVSGLAIAWSVGRAVAAEFGVSGGTIVSTGTSPLGSDSTGPWRRTNLDSDDPAFKGEGEKEEKGK
jgi:hypothetical protein